MSNADLISSEKIENAIYMIRGEKVMLARHLALLYGVGDEGTQTRGQQKSPPIPARFHVSTHGR